MSIANLAFTLAIGAIPVLCVAIGYLIGRDSRRSERPSNDLLRKGW
jgi:hypothetical protein